jgi:hypothetical protein
VVAKTLPENLIGKSKSTISGWTLTGMEGKKPDGRSAFLLLVKIRKTL